MKSVKVISISLGLISLVFGLLKFVNPFRDWYSAQIETSGLPQFAFAFGIIGEIAIGLAFLFPFFVTNISVTRKKGVLIFAHTSLILMMVAATIIHLIPSVPAEVLPLKIKPPAIPLVFAVIAILNLIKIVRGNENIKHRSFN